MHPANRPIPPSSKPSAPLVPHFLNAVDWVGATLGLNVPPIVVLAQVRSLPPHTLGHSLADFLSQHHLEPLTTGPRRKQLHDLVHVVTGYGTDAIGETEVQAFLLGAKFRLAHLILGLGLLEMIRRQAAHAGGGATPVSDVYERLRSADERGHASRFDLATWQPETQWHLPLSQVQAQLGILPLERPLSSGTDGI